MSISIIYIHSPANNDQLWTLKNNLIEFNSTVGRHTGEMIGKDLVTTIQKYRSEKKVRPVSKLLTLANEEFYSLVG